MQRKILAKSLVVNPNGEVLVLQRSSDDENRPGGVDFPGGGVEPGESYSAAASREILEESGISIFEYDLVLAYAFTVYDIEAHTIITRLLYMGHPSEVTVQLSDEHDSFWWKKPQELAGLFKKTSWYLPLQFVGEYKLLDQ